VLLPTADYRPNGQSYKTSERRKFRHVDELISPLPPLTAHATDTTIVSNKATDQPQQADERTSLLTHVNHTGEEIIHAGKEAWLRELQALWKLAIPNWIAFLLEFSIGGITTVTAGRLGTKELNAASLAQITMTSLCLAPLIYGFSTGERKVTTVQSFRESEETSCSFGHPGDSGIWLQES
jgi:hypothetical protein